MVDPRKVVWDEIATDQLKQIFQFIRSDSLQNAEKVKREILKIVRSIPNHPFKFPPDKFKEENDGSYRAFVKYNYRVAYRVTGQQIKILTVRSDKQEPLIY